jgi:hypothetical protein
MAVRILCSQCDQKLNVPEDMLGKKVRCPSCKAAFIADTKEPDPPPRPEPVEQRTRRARADAEPADEREPESDRPGRSARRKAEAPAAPRDVSVLGIISLVLGLLGLPLSLIPCLNVLGLPLVGLGLLLGIIGFFVAQMGKKSGIGFPIAGSLVCLVGLMVSLAWIGLMVVGVQNARIKLEEEAKELRRKEEQEAKDIREGQAVVVTAVDLFRQYKANELAGDNKYKDRVVELSGIVVRVNPGNGGPTVELKTDDEDENIDCEFPEKGAEDAAKLVSGKPATIRGKCKGRDLGTITLEKCIVK